MRFRFQFRPYSVPFRVPVRTSHGFWTKREGVIVRLQDAAEGAPEDAVGYGEAAPIPAFGTESPDEIAAACGEIGEWVEGSRLDDVPVSLGCLRHAITAARAEAGLPGAMTTGTALAVAALLPAGRAALPLIGPKSDMGFRVFKWKVGVGEVADELGLLDEICAALPNGAKLRLDANGAWDRRKAERWLERCADRPVEFVEQPCYVPRTGSAQGTDREQERTNDLLRGLAEDFPTPIALDESLVGNGDVERWIGAGWRGVFVVKSSLIGDVAEALTRLEKAQADVVFSSALETAVGARAALRVAFRFAARSASQKRKAVDPEMGIGKLEGGDGKRGRPQGEPSAAVPSIPPRALGFGVWPLFAEARFDAPFAMPFVRAEDVERIDAEAVWNALS